MRKVERGFVAQGVLGRTLLEVVVMWYSISLISQPGTVVTINMTFSKNMVVCCIIHSFYLHSAFHAFNTG